MKQVLTLCLLFVVAFANVEIARADSFAFGAAGFDDQKTMLANLKSLLTAGQGQYIQSLSDPKSFLSMGSAYVALIGVSQDVVGTDDTNSFVVMSDSSGGYVMESSSLSEYWTSTSLALDQLSLKWQGGSAVSLTDILNNYAGVTVSGAFYYGQELVYQPDGYTPVSLSGGTVFIGLNLGLGNEVDVILAFSAAPINAVPVPAAVWLLGSGVAGIMVLRKRMI